MSNAEICYNLFAVLSLICIIYPPKEFTTIGLTLDSIFKRQLCGGSTEELEFVQYHIKRTCFTFFIHTALPFIYILFYYLQFTIEINNTFVNIIWQSIIFGSVLAPLISICIIKFYWKIFKNHPITNLLRKYSNNNTNNNNNNSNNVNSNNCCGTIVSDINAELRRANRFVYKMNAISTVYITDNWIIKTSPYMVNFAHQSDTALIAIKSDSHLIGTSGSNEPVQFVNILVKPTRAGVTEFTIRLNAFDFKELQDRIIRPITILSGVVFNKSLIDVFIDVFINQIQLNERYRTTEPLDSCIACMHNKPNIKLIKHCMDREPNELEQIFGDRTEEAKNCENCYCRPMWCVQCLAKWFATRQSEHDRDIWLQQKCRCPMCRGTFCILDVCLIETE